MDDVLLRALLIETKKVIGPNASMSILSSAYSTLNDDEKKVAIPMLQEMFSALKRTTAKNNHL